MSNLFMTVTITDEDMKAENPVMHAMLRQTRESIDDKCVEMMDEILIKK